MAEAERPVREPVRAVPLDEAAVAGPDREALVRAPGILAAGEPACASRGSGASDREPCGAWAISLAAEHHGAQAVAGCDGFDERDVSSVPAGPGGGGAGTLPRSGCEGAADGAAARLLQMLRGPLRGETRGSARDRGEVWGLPG